MEIAALLVIAIFGGLVLFIISKLNKPRAGKLDQDYYRQHWEELLTRVKTPEGMMLAVIDADKLLDKALKKCRYKGKTMGERMVSAQRILSDNDGAWYAHKLRNRLVHEPGTRLKKNEAQKALAGFRQALKDLGAL